MAAQRVKVRMLVDLGGHHAGDEVMIVDKPLPEGYATDGSTTLIESYEAAGYVERVL